ncbi:MAG: repressor LexA [Candidatus Taylorbacteria bacterium]|nr:repressor LexA [Candidatus Taylorbacteria bacterium]
MPKVHIDLQTAQKQIYTFFSTHKRMPSYQEICTICKLGSKNTAHTLVQKLKATGALETDKLGKILPTKHKQSSIKLLGLVEAGFPTPSEESLHEQISLDDWVIQKKESSYMLKVKGDSMKDAGILDGDMVIVERTTTPKIGQIVVAEIDGSYTLKYLRKGSSRYFLEAANSKYKPMYPTEELQIIAVVKAVVRKYA